MPFVRQMDSFFDDTKGKGKVLFFVLFCIVDCLLLLIVVFFYQ